jgi:hypothetical protein
MTFGDRTRFISPGWDVDENIDWKTQDITILATYAAKAVYCVLGITWALATMRLYRFSKSKEGFEVVICHVDLVIVTT